MKTHTLDTGEADIVYDVQGPSPTADGRPALFMIGQPMDASGFRTLASYFPDRTVITYDPRGLGRSTRKDGRVDNAPTVQAGDVHAVIRSLDTGPVEMFASSGGAVTALALVTAYPDDVTVLVAHEPPLVPVLPDAGRRRTRDGPISGRVRGKGWGAGMAAFIAMTSWHGEFTEEYFAQPIPDPAQFGMPAEDDGSRDNPMLSRPFFCGHQLSPRRRGAGRGTDTHRDRCGRRVRGNIHRTRSGGHAAAIAGSGGDGLPSHHGGFVGGRIRIRWPA